MESNGNRIAALAATLWIVAGAGLAQTTIRASEGTGGVEGNGISQLPDVSADGRHVVFSTRASSITGDPTGESQVVAHDRDPDGNGVFDEGNGVTALISVSSGGVLGVLGSGRPSVSGDGRFVAFESSAANLIPGDSNGDADVFLRDRDPDGNGVFDEPGSGTTVRVGTATAGQPNGPSTQPRISLDGRYVAFLSQATNMVSPDANGTKSDVFRYDRTSLQVLRANSTLAGTSPNAPSSQPGISGDGARVVFYSPATDIVAGPISNLGNLYCRDFTTGGMALFNLDSAGNLANGLCDRPAISADGLTVAFSSTATNLDPLDTDLARDVYVRTLPMGVTELVSLNSLGVKGNADGTIAGHQPSLSADGSKVCFWSRSTNLYYNQNVLTDVYVHDRSTGQTMVTSVDSGGYPADASSADFNGNRISANGETTVYYSTATNLVPGDTNGVGDVFAHDWCNPLLDMGFPKVGASGMAPVLEACGGLASGDQLTFRMRHGSANSESALIVSLFSNPVPFFGGTLVPATPWTAQRVTTNAAGEASLTLPAGGGVNVFYQWVMREPGGVGMTHAVCAPMLP